MVEVTLTCVATSQGAKMGSHKKKLPSSTTLAALRTLCEKLCKVGPAFFLNNFQIEAIF